MRENFHYPFPATHTHINTQYAIVVTPFCRDKYEAMTNYYYYFATGGSLKRAFITLFQTKVSERCEYIEYY
jgi:hypothetical protein